MIIKKKLKKIVWGIEVDKFVLDLKSKKDYTAGSKAREDVEIILKKMNFKKKYIFLDNEGKNLVGTSIALFNIKKQLRKIMFELPDNSLLLVQYPWKFLSFNIAKLIEIESKKKNIKTVVLIHDLNSYRTGSKVTKLYYEYLVKEFSFLNIFDFIIAHNSNMKQILIDKGIPSNKIKIIRIFDYLLNDNLLKDHFKDKDFNKIIVGGNLSPNKAGYLYKLNNLPMNYYRTCLFGPYYEGSSTKRIKYMGTFPADELPMHINRGFGLVWDGNETGSCSGNFGEYLKINNPHKASMYLACGIPIIVWKKAAISNFVINNKVGIVIESLNEIDDFFKNLTDEDYQEYLRNVSSVRKKIINGKYLQDCITEILSY